LFKYRQKPNKNFPPKKLLVKIWEIKDKKKHKSTAYLGEIWAIFYRKKRTQKREKCAQTVKFPPIWSH
jgi:ribosomal protein L35AE/L33A